MPFINSMAEKLLTLQNMLMQVSFQLNLVTYFPSFHNFCGQNNVQVCGAKWEKINVLWTLDMRLWSL